MERLEDYADLEDYTQWVANDEGRTWISKYVSDLEFSASRHYDPEVVNDVNARKGCLRMSSLGKPAVLQLLQYPHIIEELEECGYEVEQDDPTERKSLMFHLGDIFEAWFELFLQRQSLEVLQPPDKMGRQWEFSFKGVKGHADIICRVPETNTYFIIDCKATGSYAQRELAKDPWRSKPEYVTQISLYAHCFREYMKREYIDTHDGDYSDYEEPTIIPTIASLNCDERRVYYTYIDEELAQASVNRAAKLIEVLPTIKNWADMKGKIKPPPGVPVLYRNKPIGQELTVPPSMKFCSCLDLFYDVRQSSVKTTGNYTKKFISIGSVDEEGEHKTRYVDPEDFQAYNP